MSGPTVGALFAGYGGIELALHDVFGAEPAWFSEFEAAPSRILAHHWPDVPNLGDITKVDWSAVEPVDIITGGSPCQDLSHAGKRAGMKAGTRSGLWASMCDAIDILRPSLVVWENVRGALSAEATSAVEPCPICVGDGGAVTLRALGRVLGDLAELGYDAAWTGLRAADVGAPHGRFRVFVLAWPAADAKCGGWDGRARAPRRGEGRRTPADGGPQGPLLPTPRSSDGDKGLRTTAGAAQEFTRKGTGADLATVLALLPTPAVNDMGAGKSVEAWDEWTAKMKALHGNGNGHGASLSIELQRVESGWGPYTAAIERWEPLIGRRAPTPSEGARVREWMQGLPDGWVTDVPGVSRNDQLKALGNGVVPQQCATAVRHLLTIRTNALRSAVS